MWHLHDGEHMHIYERILALVTNSHEMYFGYHRLLPYLIPLTGTQGMHFSYFSLY
jgi:hypothetical protein